MRDKQYRKIPSEVLALGFRFRAGLRGVIFLSAVAKSAKRGRLN